MEKRIQSICVGPATTVIEAMKIINASVHGNPPAPEGIALVTGTHGVLLGIVTDGDIRRFLIAGGDLSAPVAAAMNKTPFVVSS